MSIFHQNPSQKQNFNLWDPCATQTDKTPCTNEAVENGVCHNGKCVGKIYMNFYFFLNKYCVKEINFADQRFENTSVNPHKMKREGKKAYFSVERVRSRLLNDGTAFLKYSWKKLFWFRRFFPEQHFQPFFFIFRIQNIVILLKKSPVIIKFIDSIL